MLQRDDITEKQKKGSGKLSERAEGKQKPREEWREERNGCTGWQSPDLSFPALVSHAEDMQLSPCPGRAGFVPWVPLPPSPSPGPPWQCRWLLASPGSPGVLSPAELCWSHLPPDVTSFPSCSRNSVDFWSFWRLFVLLVFPEHISWHTFTPRACRFPKLSVTTGGCYIPIYPV